MPDSIKVSIYLHSTLIEHSPDGRTRKFSVQLPDSSTIDDLLTHLGIAHASEGMLYGLNGGVADETSQLKTGDTVHIMMPISGG